MATKEPSNVMSITQAEQRRAKGARRKAIRRALPYVIILIVAGLGGVASLRSMPVGISMPTASVAHP